MNWEKLYQGCLFASGIVIVDIFLKESDTWGRKNVTGKSRLPS
jgi:hypothetical protein